MEIKSKNQTKTVLAALLVAVLLSSGSTGVALDKVPSGFKEKKFSITFRDTQVKDALKLIAQKANTEIDIDEKLSATISFAFENATLEEAILQIAKDAKLDVSFVEGVLVVDSQAQARAPASSGVRRILVKYSNAEEVLKKIPKVLAAEENLIVDDATNSLVFYGSERSFEKVMDFVEAFDKMPSQILIEAQIIETTKNFLRDIGFRWGETVDSPSVGKSAQGTGYIRTGSPGNPNLLTKFLLGRIDGRNLEAHIAASEAKGDAKTISRPKVVTLNNQPATINSGITFHVKTLSAAPSGVPGVPGGPPGGAPGGFPGGGVISGKLEKVTAGLALTVHPLIVGEGLVRMKISVSNSETNDGFAVDGIPGIVDNSANTSIIVQDGNTAALAGLIKSAVSKAHNQAPYLSQIPILGWLFKSTSNKDRNSELVIFITPKVVLANSAPSGSTPPTALKSIAD